MKLNNLDYYSFFFLLLVFNGALGMDTDYFQVENTPRNQNIIKMSEVLQSGFQDVDFVGEKIPLALIKNPATWDHMSLLYESVLGEKPSENPEKSIVKELKKVDVKALIDLSDQCDILDIKYEKISLLSLYYDALSKKLDITKDRKLISTIKENIRKKIVYSAANTILRHTHKIIRPDQAFYDKWGSMRSFGSLGTKFVACRKTDGEIYNLEGVRVNFYKALKGHTTDVVCVAITPDEKRCFTGAEDGTVKIWEIATGSCINTFSYKSAASAMACNHNATQLACGYRNGVIIIWNIADGTQHLIFETDRADKPCYSVAFNKVGTQIITTNGYNATRYCTETGNCLGNLLHTKEVVAAVAFNSEGTKAVTGSHACAYLWDLSTREIIRTFDFSNDRLPGRTDWINCVRLSKDDKLFYGTNSDDSPFTIVCDVQTAQKLGQMGGISISLNGILIPGNGILYSGYLKSLFNESTKSERKKKEREMINLQPGEYLPLIRALYIKNIYKEFTKNKKRYVIGSNETIDAIINAMTFNGKRFISLSIEGLFPTSKKIEQTSKQIEANENQVRSSSSYASKIVFCGSALFAITGIYLLYYLVCKTDITKMVSLSVGYCN